VPHKGPSPYLFSLLGACGVTEQTENAVRLRIRTEDGERVRPHRMSLKSRELREERERAPGAIRTGDLLIRRARIGVSILGQNSIGYSLGISWLCRRCEVDGGFFDCTLYPFIDRIRTARPSSSWAFLSWLIALFSTAIFRGSWPHSDDPG
jgi:hypothetical protein